MYYYRPEKAKRLYKRQKPLRAFVNRYAIMSNTDGDNLSVGITEKHGKSGGKAKFCWNNAGIITNYKIKINPYFIRAWTIKNGYTNGYYNNRKEKLAFMKNNFKLSYRFVILHELGHIHFYQKYYHLNADNRFKHTLVRRELYADSFALRYLKLTEVNDS